MEELIPITMFMCIAAVMILRPISTRVGKLLEAITQERLRQAQPVRDDAQLARAAMLLEQVARRLELVEERLDFTERLVSSGRRPTSMPRSESVGVFDDVGLSREPLQGLRG